MHRLMDVSAAARELKIDPSRVRVLIARGDLCAEKVAGRWLVDPESIARLVRSPRSSGRPFAPQNAWAIIFRASGEPVEWLEQVAMWKVNRALRLQGIAELGPRLNRRANVLSYRAHPGELRHLSERDGVVRSGISAAGEHGLDLVSSSELDVYVREDRVAELAGEHALLPEAPSGANVVLRAVPAGAWHLGDRGVAPLAAVALDLASDSDSRSAKVASEVLKQLDNALAKSRS
jgi:Helix-turn-helix domain